MALSLVAGLALAPAADASTHVLRPISTLGSGQWTVTPSGTPAHQALADAVVQPAAPDTSTGFLTSPVQGQSSAAVGVGASSLAAGENITGATAWVYLETGATRTATVYIFTGSKILGYASVPAGQAPRWYAVPSSVPTPAQAATLDVAIAPAGKTSTAVNAYAAYVALTTDAPDPVTPVSGGGTPGDPAGEGTTTGVGGSTSGSADQSATSPLAATLTLAASTPLSATPAGVVKVPVTCPVVQFGGCTGHVSIELLRSSASAARRRKVVLRSSRRFRVAAGARGRVPVRLNRRARRAMKNKARHRARITVTTDLGQGKHATSMRVITVRARRVVRRFRGKR